MFKFKEFKSSIPLLNGEKYSKLLTNYEIYFFFVISESFLLAHLRPFGFSLNQFGVTF